MTDATDPTDTWARERPRLLGLAYTVLGTWADAEDAVSEAWLRLHRVSGTDREPRDVPAWLTVVVSRLALDAATTAARQRETYVGPWLPEPVLQEDPADRTILADGVDLAFLRLLQSLSPVDRVILILAEVAGMAHQEISAVTGTTPAASRQRLRRARAALLTEQDTPPRTVDRHRLDSLATALNDGDLASLVEQLSEGCVLWTDSGGLTKAARNPVHGRDRVTRFLAGLIGRYGMPEVQVADSVGGPVLRAVSADMTRIITLETDGSGGITGIQVQQNPHKTGTSSGTI